MVQSGLDWFMTRFRHGSTTTGSDTVQTGSDTAQTRFKIVQTRFRLVQTGSDTVQAGSDTVKTRFRLVQTWFRHGSGWFRPVQTRFASHTVQTDSRPTAPSLQSRGVSLQSHSVQRPEPQCPASRAAVSSVQSRGVQRWRQADRDKLVQDKLLEL